MSEIMSETVQSSSLTADDIIEWLGNNPDFLQQNPQVCDLLVPPERRKGKDVADFQSYLIQRLKDDKEEVIESTREIVETSRANMGNQARIHKAILMILEAQNFEDFIHVITMDFAALLDVDIISLIVEADGDVIPHIGMTGVRAVNAGMLESLMQDKLIILENQINGLEELYGGGAKLVKSQTLLRLNIAPGLPAALLAFGSRDPDMFQPDHGTEMIIFLGQVTERCFCAWLNT